MRGQEEGQKKPMTLQGKIVIASVTYLRLVSVAFFSKHFAIAFKPASPILLWERLIQNKRSQERSETHGSGRQKCDLLETGQRRALLQRCGDSRQSSITDLVVGEASY